MKTKLDMLVAIADGVDRAVGEVVMSKDFCDIKAEDIWELVQLYVTARKNTLNTQVAFNEVRELAGL